MLIVILAIMLNPSFEFGQKLLSFYLVKKRNSFFNPIEQN